MMGAVTTGSRTDAIFIGRHESGTGTYAKLYP